MRSVFPPNSVVMSPPSAAGRPAERTATLGLLDKWRSAPPDERWARLRRRVGAEVRTAWYRRRFRRVDWGPGARAFGKVKITGPGRVAFGARCRIDGVDVQTKAPDARVAFGDDCYINHPELRAAASITIGSRCIVGSVLILDTDLHSVRRDRWLHQAPVRVAPVVVEDDVWLAARCAVLPGIRIGAGSVVGLGTVVHRDVPPDVVVGPSPMAVLKELPQAE